MFAALNTVEPPILDRQIAVIHERDRPWAAERLPLVHDRIRDPARRALRAASATPTGSTATFSAGDLMMVTVLQRLATSGLLAEFPNLPPYLARAEARPAFQRAFAAQLAVFQAAGQ